MKIIKPSALPIFNRASDEIKSWENDKDSNCYTYAINDISLKAINIGALNKDFHLDKSAWWRTENGLNKCMTCDGWDYVRAENIQLNMHLIMVMGVFRKVEMNYPNFHVLRMDGDGHFSAKSGFGIKPVFTGTDIGNKIPMTPDNVFSEISPIIAIDNIQAVFGGFWKIPDKGLVVHQRSLKNNLSLNN